MSPFAFLPDAIVSAWPSLSASSKDAAVILASYMNGDKDGGAWPSIEAMAERAGKSARHIRRGLAGLRKLDLIEAKRRGPHDTWRYKWADTRPDKSVPSKPSRPDKSVRQTGQNRPSRPDKSVPLKDKAEGCGGRNAIPAELDGLTLYENDGRLVEQWPDLLASWARAFPYVDIPAEVAKAHAWEVANPKRRKKDRAAFLARWIKRADEDARKVIEAEAPPALDRDFVDQMEAEAAEYGKDRR